MRVEAQAEDVRLTIQSREAQVAKIHEEQERLKQQQQQVVIGEQDAKQLASARQLLALKAFSWNKMIADIEAYVPKDARVVSIKVSEFASAGREVSANVEINALGKGPAQMTEMMSSLEKSGGLFELGQVNQDAPGDGGESPFTINVIYRPVRGGA